MAGSRSHLTSAMAVELRGVCKSFTSPCRKSLPAISDVCMGVPIGVIYGLLGPSGCGKTTLLRCIVGRLKVDKGSIAIFGEYPGTPASGIPGPLIGYMPQEVALFKELTLLETLHYFGRLLQMPAKEVRERVDFVHNLLHLPDKTHLVRNLSGGQQRRLSFACALLNEPKLLILDEPTVGVDPVLRMSIWQHMINIANSTKCTIIITTHYIEEANNANVVGMMRNGRILTESSPKALLQMHRMSNLEDVFLRVCCIDDNINAHTLQASSSTYWNDTALEADATISNKKYVPSFEKPNFQRVKAIFIKNMIKLKRNPGFSIFQFIIPMVQIILFALAIHDNPHGIHISCVNDDVGTLGQIFLGQLNNHTILVRQYSSKSDAEDLVRKGNAWGTISIGANFSKALYQRYQDGVFADTDAINESEIIIRMDMTNQQISYTVATEILHAYSKFSTHALETFRMNTNLGNSPIAFKEPIYGNPEPTIYEFMAPGFILSITYFMAFGLTALAFVLERKDGLLDRSWVTGVTETEVMLSHIAMQGLVMIVQVALLLVCAIAVFKMPCKGPPVIIVLLTLLQGFCGMSFGLVVSAICTNENSATMLTLGTFYPFLLLSGIIWPIQAMPYGLQVISYILPQTYATDATRSVMSRGWTIQYEAVWLGFIISIAWILFLFILSAIILRFRK